MRRILVENARRKARIKHGGQVQRVELAESGLAIEPPPDDLLALDEALVKFEAEEPEKAKLVKLRYFAGLSLEEAADALGVSRATASRHWTYARAWLYNAITP
jgi:RNA polymerase sigma factor (TIGR02999 family)